MYRVFIYIITRNDGDFSEPVHVKPNKTIFMSENDTSIESCMSMNN